MQSVDRSPVSESLETLWGSYLVREPRFGFEDAS